MKKSLLILLFLLGVFSHITAGKRTEQQMKESAAKVLNRNTSRSAGNSINSSEIKELLSLSQLKIYGYYEGGFAVVTKDDRFDVVIGYSFTKYNKEMPCAFKWWLETVNHVMENTNGQAPAKARAKSIIKETGVGPLIKTKWGQEKPFNNKCKKNVDGQDYSLLTGCVATAMAQVMNYYKYPQKGKGENSYNIKYSDWGLQTYSANFENSYYDWNNMLDDYSSYRYSNSEDKYTDAVSLLMSDCGKAVNMIYTTYESGAYAYKVPIGLKNYFSYAFIDETKTIYNRHDYSNDDWMNMIYNTLNDNHPILYSGNNNRQNGHMFVIHGYEPDGKVIVNWGWDGSYDGSFMIDMLSSGGYSFNDNQQMIIPIPEEMKVYKLSYLIDKELFKEYELKAGDAITPEPSPTKEGYIFSGWSEIPETMPAYDVKVTGSFSKGTYKLIYMVDGVVYKTVSYDFGTPITPEEAPTKEGHTFDGWSEIPETMPANDVTVTGSFTINKYKLTYQVDGIEYKTYEVEYGATIIPEPAPSKDGYIFLGWSIIPSTMPNHDVTVLGEFRNAIESANTVTVQIDGIYYTLIGKSRTAEVTSNPNYYSGDITIPETVEYEGFTYQVTKIGEKAFYGNYDLTSVVISNSVTSIGNSAFSACPNLSFIDIPNSVQDIGKGAFSGCTQLSSIIIPYGVTTIRSSTFSYCKKLKSVKIPDTVTSIEGGANGTFQDCSALESISLPSNLTSIGPCSFRRCESLSSIIIPDKVTDIWAEAFCNCTNLKTVTIGSSVTGIWEKAFGDCI